MRSLLVVGVFCVALALGGCGRPQYVKSGQEEPPAEESHDYAQCLYEAQKATGNLSEEYDDRDDRIEEMVNNCMELKGYVED